MLRNRLNFDSALPSLGDGNASLRMTGVEGGGIGLKPGSGLRNPTQAKNGLEWGTRQRELTKKLIELGTEYNLALLAVERNNHGNGVLAHLEHAQYREIFEQKGQMGWNTTAASRPAMIENMADVLAERPELFLSEKLWSECRTFVRHGDGTTGAAPGSHDDCVMAMAIALAVRGVLAGKKEKGQAEGAAGN